MSDSNGRGRRAPSYSTSLLSGALSGLSVDLLFYPIDTLKTRLQSSKGFIQSGGFSGIYRGIGSVAVGSAPGAACFFVVYESMKPMILQYKIFGDDGRIGKAGGHMLAASTAEIAACLIRVPTEVIKSRQQTSSYGSKASTLQAFKAVWAEAGIRGYYRGFAGTIGREIPFTCIQFPLYEYFKTYIGMRSSNTTGKAHSIPTWQAGFAGSAAGAIAAGLTTPLDVVKTRIMLDRYSPQGDVNRKIIPTLRHIFVNEGLRTLFSGFIPRTLWIGLGGFVFLGTFEAGIQVLEGGRDTL
ncbi:hypothetical protein CBS101457_002522 [Exobasidium rhododendri]|nr:hypothetical protein CBS101457_002522 [Exobasidium rhododendri]